MGKAFHMLAEALSIELLHRRQDAGMEHPPTLMKKTPVSHLMRQRMLERVLQIWEKLRLEEELRLLKMCERLSKVVLGLVRDRRQQSAGHLLADHRRRLQELLL